MDKTDEVEKNAGPAQLAEQNTPRRQVPACNEPPMLANQEPSAGAPGRAEMMRSVLKGNIAGIAQMGAKEAEEVGAKP